MKLLEDEILPAGTVIVDADLKRGEINFERAVLG